MKNKPPDIYRAVFFWPLAFAVFFWPLALLALYQAAAFYYPNNPYAHKSRAFNMSPLGDFLLSVGNVKL